MRLLGQFLARRGQSESGAKTRHVARCNQEHRGQVSCIPLAGTQQLHGFERTPTGTERAALQVEPVASLADITEAVDEYAQQWLLIGQVRPALKNVISNFLDQCLPPLGADRSTAKAMGCGGSVAALELGAWDGQLDTISEAFLDHRSKQDRAIRQPRQKPPSEL